MVTKQLYILLLFCLIGKLSVAQDVEFVTKISDETVSINEQFKVVFEINASGSNFRPPVLTDNFRVLGGPLSSSQMRYVNGKISSSLSYTYILKPISEGDFIIEPASIEVDGKSYSSNPVQLKVTAAKVPNQNNPSPSQTPSSRSNSPKSNQYEIFLTESVNKKTVYQGDQLVIDYDLYTREQVESYEIDVLPDFRGFYTSELDVDPVANATRAEVNGKVYSVYPLRKTILFPQVSGDLTIEPLKMSFSIRVQEGEPVQTFFGPRYRTTSKEIKLDSREIEIEVKPLPNGAPESFNGAVGKLQFSGSIDKTETLINEAVNLNLKLTGRGNIRLIDVNLPDFPVDFETYDADVKTSVSTAGNIVSGTKTWSILMIPRANGTFEIPPIRFSYFDPQTEQYVEETVGPFALEVFGDGTTNSGATASTQAQSEIKKVGSDIRYISNEANQLKEPNSNFFNTSWFYFLLVLPLFLLVGALFTFKTIEKRSKDFVRNRKRTANKKANKQLQQAQEALNNNDKIQFFDAVYKALYGYLGNKLNIPVGELNKEKIQLELAAKNVDASTIQLLNHTLSQCEMGKFAPIELALNELYKQSEEVILKLEDQIK